MFLDLVLAVGHERDDAIVDCCLKVCAGIPLAGGLLIFLYLFLQTVFPHESKETRKKRKHIRKRLCNGEVVIRRLTIWDQQIKQEDPDGDYYSSWYVESPTGSPQSAGVKWVILTDEDEILSESSERYGDSPPKEPGKHVYTRRYGKKATDEWVREEDAVNRIQELQREDKTAGK